MQNFRLNRSRRNFLKNSLAVGAGAAILAEPLLNMLSKTSLLNLAIFNSPDFAFDIIRTDDYLHLRYFFYNAEESNGYAIRKKSSDPVFVYVQVPAQHVGEELVTKSFNQRDDITRQFSFLASNSFLAFRLITLDQRILLTPDTLLNWSDNFELITIDDFAVRQQSSVDDYQGSIQRLLDEFSSLSLDADMKTGHQNFANNQNVLWPITKLELPYKMFLSPIGEPVHFDGNGQYVRQYGEHQFVKNNKALIEYTSVSGRTQIVSPWENQLVFRNGESEISDPRWKVVHYLCQRTVDKDTDTILHPAPIHRDELRGLTMHPDYDRDVLSTVFKISVLGASTILKYRNDSPLEYSTVAWEQRVKYARDNYVSITFRALDAFTGIKLLISIFTDRDYEYGVSFLPQLYYVEYAEKEKSYKDPVVVSKIPFVKIIPQNRGAFFKPYLVKGTTKAFHVADSDPYVGNNLQCGNLLVFDYVGIDKAGQSHPFQAKIIFISAESYQITEGTYNYKTRQGDSATYTKNSPPVDIKHIGLLNPGRQEKYRNNPRPNPCSQQGTEDYWFRLEKNFDKPQQASLQANLDALRAHVTDAANKECYMLDIKGDLTYARLGGLKLDHEVTTVSGTKILTSAIRKDSSNATFNTRDILILCQLNPYQYVNSAPAEDNFNASHPAISSLIEGNVIVSQLDQIEGARAFRNVSYDDAYSNGEMDIDIDNPKNRAKLLFRLNNRISDFFTQNYRSAGAMVNTGIEISHISVLDQTISYNEEHNDIGTGATSAVFNVPERVRSASIFRNLNAEILGIPLRAIIEEFLPVKDLPVFNYVQQAEQSIEKIKNVVNQYRQLADKWINEYNKAKAELQQYIQLLGTLDVRINFLKRNLGRAWLESLIEQTGAKDYLRGAERALQERANEYSQYWNSVLKPIDAWVKTNKVNLDTKLSALSGNPELAQLQDLVATARSVSNFSPRLMKETVKYYCINQLATTPQVNSAFIAAIELKEKLDSIYQDYFSAFAEGYREAVQFTREIIQENSERVQSQIYEAKRTISDEVSRALPKDFIQKNVDWILKLFEIAKVCDHYYKLYRNLKKQDYYQLARDYSISLASDVDAKIQSLEDALYAGLQEQLEAIIINAIPASGDQLIILTEFKNEMIRLVKGNNDWFRNYETTYKQQVEKLVANRLSSYYQILAALDKEYEDVKADYKRVKALIDDIEALIRDFVYRKIEEAKAEIEKNKRDLIGKVKNSPEYQQITAHIADLQALVRKIEEISKIKLEYTYCTKRFRPMSTGAIDFDPKDTELSIRVAYETHLSVQDLDKLPIVTHRSFITDSRLTNFKLGVLRLLYIDFLEVRFITGSDIKDDFQVKIRDVQFAGCLSFVEAFQKFLSTISNNLVFDIDSKGARIGYGFSIPDFSAGWFNFFNFNLSALLTLPFNPKDAMQIQFGFGSPLNKFGLTMSGIFGGQGYFNLIAEPRRGIVGMEIVLEFGAIFKLNLIVASGTAYLVGGVYIRRYGSNFLLKAYILAVGRLNVLGLFSASVTFYLGLEGDGNVLEGACIVTVSKRFTRFFEISIDLEFRKTIKGTKSDSPKSERVIAFDGSKTENAANTYIIDSNLDKMRFTENESIYVVLSTANVGSVTASIDGPSFKFTEDLTRNASSTSGGRRILPFSKNLSELNKSGAYNLEIKFSNGSRFRRNFTIEETATASCIQDAKSTVSPKDYYASYYQ